MSAKKALRMNAGVMIPRWFYSIHQMLPTSKPRRSVKRQGRSKERWNKPDRHWLVAQARVASGRYEWR